MTGVRARLLAEPDLEALGAFLDRHPDTTLFLRSNLAEAGLGLSDHPFAGIWTGVFSGSQLESVSAHFNGGNVVVAGDGDVQSSARLAVESSRRPVRGVVGPWETAWAALEALCLDASPRLESRELLYGIALERLLLPDALGHGRVRCRRSREAELDDLTDWRLAFEAESLGMQGVPGQRVAARENVLRAHDLGRLFVLEDERGTAVATSAFNAAADGIVQVGGVFTSPGVRGRGHGRSVVAGSLLDARAAGAVRSVLFTGETNHAAQRAYAALGYEVVGDYGLLLF